MGWFSKRRETPSEQPEETVVPEVSEETARAEAAARAAGRQLATVRQQLRRSGEVADELESINDRNGFYLLVREALRIG